MTKRPKTTIDGDRWEAWRRTVNAKLYQDPTPREIPEKPMQVRFERPDPPPSCQMCGAGLYAWPKDGDERCARCRHKWHGVGCGCPFDVSRGA